jgi:GNAT superfamily N-acetyltransferase
MKPSIRRAVAGDRSAVAATVAAAFAVDPAWAFILGEEYGRLAVEFAAALFDLRVVLGNVWVAGDGAAVAMWDPPGVNDRPPGLVQSVWARYRAVAGEEALRRLSIYNDAVAAASPAEAHWYLGVLATHPQRRREGLATSVLAPVLGQADRAGVACCLETSTMQNRRFYERRGFTQATAIAVPEGPPTWWLCRPVIAPAATNTPARAEQPPEGSPSRGRRAAQT